MQGTFQNMNARISFPFYITIQVVQNPSLIKWYTAVVWLILCFEMWQAIGMSVKERCCTNCVCCTKLCCWMWLCPSVFVYLSKCFSSPFNFWGIKFLLKLSFIASKCVVSYKHPVLTSTKTVRLNCIISEQKQQNQLEYAVFLCFTLKKNTQFLRSYLS